jgi:dipeptidyl aminopeptidase/acylaminoacyl peptidase
MPSDRDGVRHVRHQSLALALAAALALPCSSPAHAGTSAADGALLSSEPCPANPLKNYADYISSVRATLSSEGAAAREEKILMPIISEERLRAALPAANEVREKLAYRGFECRIITYASGGLKIGGLLWKPLATEGKRLPLVVALRGGNNRFGPMEPWRYWGMFDFLKAGYVVLASQYRGGPGSEGTDGFGSKGDLDDVRNLVPLAASLGYVDVEQVFAHGGSRGGMQLYMLAREGFPLKAMAIRAGMADFRRNLKLRPAQAFALELMQDYSGDLNAALDRRSAALWANELKVPSIIFHGTDDWRVPVEDALDVAHRLRKGGTPFEMHLYEGDTHTIDLNQEDMIKRTVEFFERWRAKARR